MMKIKTVFLLLLLPISVTAFAQEAKYGIKSAILKKEAVSMGQKVQGMQYFDEYGKKEASELTMKIGGVPNMEKHIRTLVDGDKVISIDLDMKVANKTALPIKLVNYLNLTDEVRALHHIKEVGQEEILGKMCTKYTLEMVSEGQAIHSIVWIWKGIPLKNEISSNRMLVLAEVATEIQENVEVPADKFLIPEGITVP